MSLGSLFGGSSDKAMERASANARKAAETGFSGGGLTGTYGGKSNRYMVSSSSDRDELIGEVRSTFTDRATQLASLRERVAPGVSDLRASRLRAVEDARVQSIGNLRENLQRRRVLGSSFGMDSLTRAEAEFGREKERVEAESFLQELELTKTFLAEENDATRNAFVTQLTELNLQAELASNLATTASKQLSDASRLEMRLAAAEAAGAGKFFGDVLQQVGTIATKALFPTPKLGA